MLIGVVIVTYNRLEKLKKCLASYEAQSYLPNRILVYNNASTDGTKEYLDQWSSCSDNTIRKTAIHSPDNKGGAGGFKEGIRLMAEDTVDWIWVADDDAYPMPQCLENIQESYLALPIEDAVKTMALCTKVIDSNGMVSPLHRRKLRRSLLQVRELPLKGAQVSCPARIDFFSFVGTAIRTAAIHQIGLPDQDYFIYFDDSEYALRIGAIGTIFYAPDAVIMHDSKENEISRCSWKNYYMFRNKLYTYKKYFPARYYHAELCRTVFMILRHYNCLVSWQQFRQAVSDVRNDRLGASPRYLP